MRKTLLLIGLILGLSGAASAQVTVGGNLISLGLRNVTSSNTYVQFKLENYGSYIPRVIGTGTIVAATQNFLPNNLGIFTGTIEQNNGITPANTFYQVCVYNNGVQFRCARFLINSPPYSTTTPWNLNTATPLTVTMPGPVVNLLGLSMSFMCLANPPPTPPAGQETLYENCADKSLYYIDDTGRIVGALGPGGSGGSGIGGLLWSSTVSYPLGAQVTYNQQPYISLTNSNLNNLPTNNLFWKLVSNGGGVGVGIPFPGPDPVYDVTNAAYGAVGDGITDDTVAIQKAINAQETAQAGGHVYFPCGKIFKFGSLDLTGFRYGGIWTILEFCGIPKPTATINLYNVTGIMGHAGKSLTLPSGSRIATTGFDLSAFPSDGSPVINVPQNTVGGSYGPVLISGINIEGVPAGADAIKIGTAAPNGAPTLITVQDTLLGVVPGSTGSCIESNAGFGLYLYRIQCAGGSNGLAIHTGIVWASDIQLEGASFTFDQIAGVQPGTGLLGTVHVDNVYTENMSGPALFTIHTNGYGGDAFDFGPGIYTADPQPGGGLYIVNHTGDSTPVKFQFHGVSDFTGFTTAFVNGPNLIYTADGTSGIYMSNGAFLDSEGAQNSFGPGGAIYPNASLTVNQFQVQNPALVVKSAASGEQGNQLEVTTADHGLEGSFFSNRAFGSLYGWSVYDTGTGFKSVFAGSPLTGDRIYTLPDSSGTLCLSTGNCSNLFSGPFNVLTSGTNTQAAMLVGTGASLGTAGTGTIAATSMPFTGLGGGTNTTSAMVCGTGCSLTVAGTGTNNATAINGTNVPVNTSADQFILTTAAATGSWGSIPLCLDSSGNHLNYNTTTHSLFCGTSGGTAGSAAFNTITPGTNSSAAMVVGTGASISTTGSGSIAATSAPFSGLGASTNSTAAMVVGTGASLDVSGSGSINATKVNGTTVPTNASADQLLNTSAPATGVWTSVPNCTDAGGNHINYNTATHLFSCGTSGGTAGSAAFNTITPGTNTSATMVCGTGCVITPTGTGSIVATTTPFSGVTGSTNTTAALVLGSGSSLNVTGTGTNNATSIHGTTVPVNGLVDQTLVTSAAQVGSWASIPLCLDTAGQHINYNTSSHTWGCGTSGNAFSGGLGASYQDATEIAAPANPAAGNDRLFLNSSTHALNCLTSSGGNCLPNTGSVTAVNTTITGGILSGSGCSYSVSGTCAITLAGTSGGLPYFSSATTWASSGALPQYGVVLGGGAGGAPTSTAADSNTAHVLLGGSPPAFGAITAGIIPTLNQNTTGSAAKWTTARNLAGNSVDGSANVPFANAFIVQGTTDTGLTGAQFLGALGTGLVKNTTTTGVLSIAASTDVTGLFSGTCNGSTFLAGDGSCQTPMGAGNVSNTGTPTAGQLATWTSATVVQGVTALPTANVPAFTGDMTNSAGSLATTVGKINGTALSGLATGILKNTTGTGVPSIAVAGDFPTLNQSTTGNAATATTTGQVNGAGLPASKAIVGTNSSSQIIDATAATLSNNTTGSAAKWTTARALAGNNVDGSAAVAFANKFIVQGTTDAGLSGAQFLGALGTGIMKNTTTTGVLSVAVAGDFPTLNQNTSGNAATATTATTATDLTVMVGAPAGSFPCSNGANEIACTPGMPTRTTALSTDTILTGDRGSLVKNTNTTTGAVTLPQAGSTGFGSYFYYTELAAGTAPVVITPTPTSTLTVNGVAGQTSLTLNPGSSAYIESDNTNYNAMVNNSFLQAGTGAVTRPVTSKLLDTVSVKDFGPAGTGSDDTPFFTLALAASRAVTIPCGTYNVTGLALTTGHTLTGPSTHWDSGTSNSCVTLQSSTGDILIAGATTVIDVDIENLTLKSTAGGGHAVNLAAATAQAAQFQFKNVNCEQQNASKSCVTYDVTGGAAFEMYFDHYFFDAEQASRTVPVIKFRASAVNTIDIMHGVITTFNTANGTYQIWLESTNAAGGAFQNRIVGLVSEDGGGGGINCGGCVGTLIENAMSYDLSVIPVNPFINIVTSPAGTLSRNNKLVNDYSRVGSAGLPDVNLVDSGSTEELDNCNFTFVTTANFIVNINSQIGALSPSYAVTTLNSTTVSVGNNILASAGGETISSGFGTSPSVVAGNTSAFTVNVGTGGTATGGVIGMPTATTGWICSVHNLTARAANRASDTYQTASTTTTVTVQNQTLSSGAAVAWTASDTLTLTCMGY